MTQDTKNEADLVLYDFLKDVGNSDTRIMGKLSNLDDIKLCEFILSKFLMMKMQWYFSFSSFKAEKNAFSQNPIVRLYSVYYPGEWYPPNAAGNPTGQGAGKAWPNDFPIRFAEIVGDLTSDILYNVSYGGTSYIPFPVNSSTLSQGSEGTIDEITLDIFNVDNIITGIEKQ